MGCNCSKDSSGYQKRKEIRRKNAERISKLKQLWKESGEKEVKIKNDVNDFDVDWKKKRRPKISSFYLYLMMKLIAMNGGMLLCALFAFVFPEEDAFSKVPLPSTAL